jgi:hypothetical protein
MDDEWAGALSTSRRACGREAAHAMKKGVTFSVSTSMLQRARPRQALACCRLIFDPRHLSEAVGLRVI